MSKLEECCASEDEMPKGLGDDYKVRRVEAG